MEIENHLFLFSCENNHKYPENVMARYCFYDEVVNIEDDIKMEVTKGCWLVYSMDNNLLFMLSMDDFIKNFKAHEKQSKKYFEFVVDSHMADYSPNYNALDDALLESINDLREKEISLSLMGKIRLIFDLILCKKIFISKY